MPPEAIHRVLRVGDGQAVTIHAYSPPLRRQGAYSLDNAGVLLRIARSGEEEMRADAALLAGSR